MLSAILPNWPGDMRGNLARVSSTFIRVVPSTQGNIQEQFLPLSYHVSGHRYSISDCWNFVRWVNTCVIFRVVHWLAFPHQVCKYKAFSNRQGISMTWMHRWPVISNTGSGRSVLFLTYDYSSYSIFCLDSLNGQGEHSVRLNDILQSCLMAQLRQLEQMLSKDTMRCMQSSGSLSSPQ